MMSMKTSNCKMSVMLHLIFFAALAPFAAAFSRREYADALEKSILFFDVQRSGHLPAWQRITWRADSGLHDGHQDNVDLTGGYHDAGDHVKFGLPLAFTLSVLSWNVVEFGTQLRTSRQLGNALNALRWGTDYLLKASVGEDCLWVQVGNPFSDHQCWQRPEDMDTPRTAYKVDASHPGSDVAAETAAALAAASLAFAKIDKSYSKTLLAAAKKVFAFADRYRGKYSDAIGGVVCPFYCSNNGFKDELVWGAAWLFKATGDDWYRHYLVSNGGTLGGTTTAVNEFSWDSKYAGAQVLLAKFALTGAEELRGYKDRADNYMCNVLPRSVSPTSQTSVTPGGMLWHSGQTNMQYVASAALLLTTYSKYLSSVGGVIYCGKTRVTSAQLLAYAKQQVDYILGHNPRGTSYMIGFGDKNPTHVHHRAASIPSVRAQPQKIGCQQGWPYYNSGSANPNQATGAIVGGPDQYDNINDVRSNVVQMEPTTYTNAPVVGLLAVLATGAASQ
ncbi:hypothetical protein KC19_11G137900 [Ceratodon purpureus]|uniref:cellulase n=1 Tax=Ceratodon purpureus TaxID=3225 RepID=A0A8T0GH83_CERPU|nr:hypothetical protein KC19_11G137900 [Ceratodon purpureus]